MEVSGHRKIGRPKLRWSVVIRKDRRKKKGVERTSTRPENVENEHLICRSQIEKRPKKKN